MAAQGTQRRQRTMQHQRTIERNHRVVTQSQPWSQVEVASVLDRHHGVQAVIAASQFKQDQQSGPLFAPGACQCAKTKGGDCDAALLDQSPARNVHLS